MGAVKLQLRCQQSVHGISVDPEPDWSLDAVLHELNALEATLTPVSLRSRELVCDEKGGERSSGGAFVMSLHDDDDGDESEDEEDHGRSLGVGSRFGCADDFYFSDSNDDSDGEIEPCLIDKTGVVESALVEIRDVHCLGVKEEIRNQIYELETRLVGINEKSARTANEIEGYWDARREMDKKLDTQYQRKIAEALDSHLTIVQRDHELRSQIEERKIQSDAAAYENIRKKERALQEAKLRQEKAIAEAEASRKRSEEERIAASLAAERKAEEAVKQSATEEKAASGVRESMASQMSATSGNSDSQTDDTKKSQLTGNIIKAAENALNLEQARLQKLKEITDNNQALKSNQNYATYERQIARWTKLITGTKESVRAKSNELINILNDPRCPQTISIASFAEKVVSQCDRPNNSAFACGQAIVILTSRFPHAMDIVLAEFHKACIYTVPKHISYSKSVFKSKEEYYKAIGYRETDGKLETQDAYLERLEGYIELYGALVQTQFDGVHNLHGLNEGWAWLARFLNSVPANTYTAVALAAFLKMAGFALYRRYKGQFLKILDVIFQTFLSELNAKTENPVINKIAVEIRSYVEDKRYLEEPEGWRMKESMLSSNMVPASDYQDNRSYNSYNQYHY